MGRRTIGLALALLAVVVALGRTQSGRPEGRTPAVLYERSGDLFAISTDGARIARLTKTRAAESDPAISPDGSTIAYSRDFGGGISTMKGDGRGRTVVTRGPDGDPAWSPDGRTIYFVRYRTAFAGETCGSIFTAPSGGGRARPVVRSHGVHSYLNPAVSPDGRRIAFTDWQGCAGGTSSPRVRVVTPSGQPTGDLAKLKRNGYYPDPEHSEPAWSPDGGRLAFRHNSDIAAAARDGSGERRIARGGGWLIYTPLAWSPDGSWIAYSRYDGTFNSLHLVHPDGSGPRRLARNPKVDYTVGGWLPHFPG